LTSNISVLPPALLPEVSLYSCFSPVSHFILISVDSSCSAKIGLEHVLLHHPLGVEKRTIERNRVPHHIHKAIPVLVEKGKGEESDALICHKETKHLLARRAKAI
jgi:hypothetical protein